VITETPAGRVVHRGGGIVGPVHLAYQISGPDDAPPMVLLHGLGESAASWDPVLDALAKSFRVYAVDLRGHGDSDWPGAYSFELMTADVVGLLDELRLGSVALVGHSMGGAVAYRVAVSRPDLVGRLVVEDAPPALRRELVIPERPAGPLDFDWPAVVAIRTQLSQDDPATWAGLPSITAPTLIVGGGPDSHVPQDKLAEAAGLIPRCDLVTIPAGHYVHTARPEEFASVVLSWLSS
jgi:3-oxoadipate enol-lactonase